MNCPACGSALERAFGIELPPDAAYDEISVSPASCACGFRGAAVYQESRRGALDDESVDAECVPLEPDAWTRLREAIARCPDPRNGGCGCATHRTLGARRENGRWIGII